MEVVRHSVNLGIMLPALTFPAAVVRSDLLTDAFLVSLPFVKGGGCQLGYAGETF